MNVPALSQIKTSSRDLKDQAQQAARQASPWVVRLGRFGFAANGIVYAIVGGLAAQAAIGAGGETTDTRGALIWIVQAPFGRFLLGTVGIGLAGYALWRFVQAIADTENKGTDPQGLLARGSYVFIGLVYAGTALFALRLSAGVGGGAGKSTQDWTAWLLARPFGQWLVALAGAIMIGAGLAQFYRAYSGKFLDHLKLAQMTADQRKGANQVGRFGFAARGVVFEIVGFFLIIAAVDAQPAEARGLGGALAMLAEQPFGPWLLGIVALGLMAYGAFMLLQARYRRMVI